MNCNSLQALKFHFHFYISFSGIILFYLQSQIFCVFLPCDKYFSYTYVQIYIFTMLHELTSDYISLHICTDIYIIRLYTFILCKMTRFANHYVFKYIK